MANTASANKRARQTRRRNRRCASQRSALRTAIKKVVALVHSGDREGAERASRRAVVVIDSLCGKGLIHKNKAARHKSRLHRKLVQQG